jgi:hypothetical protein
VPTATLPAGTTPIAQPREDITMRMANRTAERVGVGTVAAGLLAAGAFTLVSSARARS